jgi:hypothetical protein
MPIVPLPLPLAASAEADASHYAIAFRCAPLLHAISRATFAAPPAALMRDEPRRRAMARDTLPH